MFWNEINDIEWGRWENDGKEKRQRTERTKWNLEMKEILVVSEE